MQHLPLRVQSHPENFGKHETLLPQQLLPANSHLAYSSMRHAQGRQTVPASTTSSTWPVEQSGTQRHAIKCNLSTHTCCYKPPMRLGMGKATYSGALGPELADRLHNAVQLSGACSPLYAADCAAVQPGDSPHLFVSTTRTPKLPAGPSHTGCCLTSCM